MKTLVPEKQNSRLTVRRKVLDEDQATAQLGNRAIQHALSRRNGTGSVLQKNPQQDERREALIRDFEAKIDAEDWANAAVTLNGFNDADINLLIRKLRRNHGRAATESLYAGALQAMPGWSDRVHLPIERLMNKTPAIGYVGFNPQANKEARALKRGSPSKVIVSLDNDRAEAEFSSIEGQKEFVQQRVGLDETDTRFAKALKCLQDGASSYREQIADMMLMFRAAEIGQYRLERLVLSGHHAGSVMWGDSDLSEGFVVSKELPNLAAAFPGAAAQVQDVMFSACNSVNEIEACKQSFPRLQSIWVYEGYSPSVKQGSAQHILQWERATRGNRQPRKRDAAGHAVIWTKAEGLLVEL
jgi:hypothetical protein